MWRIVESNSVHRLTWYDTCTYLKELYPSQEAINIRCPKIKSLHNLITPTRSIFFSSSCSREFQYTSRYSNLSLWGMKERKRCWGHLQVGTPFPWTPTQRSTDAPSIGPQWTFLLRDVPLERSETPELQTHEMRHRNDKKKAQCVLIIVPQVSHQDITVVLTCKHVVQCISKTLVGHHLLISIISISYHNHISFYPWGSDLMQSCCSFDLASLVDHCLDLIDVARPLSTNLGPTSLQIRPRMKSQTLETQYKPIFICLGIICSFVSEDVGDKSANLNIKDGDPKKLIYLNLLVINRC